MLSVQPLFPAYKKFIFYQAHGKCLWYTNYSHKKVYHTARKQEKADTPRFIRHVRIFTGLLFTPIPPFKNPLVAASVYSLYVACRMWRSCLWCHRFDGEIFAAGSHRVSAFAPEYIGQIGALFCCQGTPAGFVEEFEKHLTTSPAHKHGLELPHLWYILKPLLGTTASIAWK